MTDEEFKSVMANSTAKFDESMAKFAAESARFAEEMAISAEISRKADLKLIELAKKIERVSQQMGGINENIGHHAEQFFQNVFAEKKVFGGIEYDDIIFNMEHRGKTGKVEFDIVLENGNAVALIEAKNRIHPKDVTELAEERVGKFRKYFQEYKNYDVYLGIAGFSFSEAVLEEAKKYGIGIIRQVGDGIEIDATGLRVYR